MLLVHALGAEVFAAGGTLGWEEFHVNLALAQLLWAEFEIRVGDGLAPEVGAFVLVFQHVRQVLVDIAL